MSTGPVEEFVAAYGARDWSRLAGALSDESFERVGPYVDVIGSKGEYLDFLQRVVPTLGPHYELVLERVTYGADRRVGHAELLERLEVDGTPMDIPEVIVFDLGSDGLITRMRLFLQQPGGMPPVGGEGAKGDQRASSPVDRGRDQA